MKQCPACRRELDDHLLFCPFDGQPLGGRDSVRGYVGALLDDKYRLEEKIGEGGTGEVYRATHIHMDSTVAVKILHASLASDQTMLERFRREARAAAQIRHANAVAVTDFGVTRDTGIAYLVMEFLEGEDLRERINRRRRLEYDDVLNILDQTCAAVHTAHTKGIIHRDLKPDNIWILKAEQGVERVKVLDFGIAKLKSYAGATNLTEKGLIIGTPNYMSPEQCRGEQLDPRSDIYSLGVIVYEMLTGDAPFQADTPVAVVLKHASEPPRPPSQLRPDIPIDVENVVLRALDKKRENRQGTALQLVNELEKALRNSGVPLKAPRTSTPQATTIQTSPMAAKTQAYKDIPESGSVGRTTVVSDPKVEERRSSYETQVATTEADRHLRRDPRTRLNIPNPDEGRTLIISDSVEVVKPVRGTRTLMISLAAAGVIVAAVVGLVLFGSGGSSVSNTTSGPSTATGVPIGMVSISGGTFTMGNNDSDEESEKPEHEVTVRPFYIDRYEVTNEEYYEFVRVTKHPAPEHWIEGKFPPGEDKYPVVYVDWFDAEAYAKWVGKRLPTEAEWEYAARGDDKRLYPWGNEFTPENANSKETDKNHAMPVGSYPAGASRFGLLDMAANVAEWTSSDYSLYPGSKARMESGTKIIRGGSFRFDKKQAMVTTRWSVPPGTAKDYIGFRLTKDAP